MLECLGQVTPIISHLHIDHIFQCKHTQMLHVWNMYTYISPISDPSVGKYTIHGASGIEGKSHLPIFMVSRIIYTLPGQYWNITIFNGKIHYKLPCSIAILTQPEGRSPYYHRIITIWSPYYHHIITILSPYVYHISRYYHHVYINYLVPCFFFPMTLPILRSRTAAEAMPAMSMKTGGALVSMSSPQGAKFQALPGVTKRWFMDFNGDEWWFHDDLTVIYGS